MATERNAVVYGLGAIGFFLVIIGYLRQAYQLGGVADWLANDSYVAGVMLVVAAVFMSAVWKDNQ